MKTNKPILLLRTGAFLVIFLFCSHLSNAATLNLKVFIQGFYTTGGIMNSPLYNSGLTLDFSECDSITVRLLDPATGIIVSSEKVMLYTDGSCTVNIANALVGDSYYINVCHRSCIQIMSGIPVAISTITAYDFTTSDSQAYSNNEAEVETGVWAMYSGDLNHDCIINALDEPALIADIAIFAFGYYCTDLNGDGSVDNLDLLILTDNENSTIICDFPFSTPLTCGQCGTTIINLCVIDVIDSITGNITQVPVDVDDGMICTIDACDPFTGNISHTPKFSATELNDFLPCTYDYCDAITGLIAHSLIPGCSECSCDSQNITSSIIVNTGYDINSGNALGNNGEPDFNWTLVNQPVWSSLSLPYHPPTIYYNPFNNPNYFPFPNSQWISPFPFGNYQNNTIGNPFTFEFAFCVCNDDSITFNFHSLADDSIGFYLDNYSTIFPYQSITTTGQQAGQMNYNYKVLVPKGRHFFRADLRNMGGGPLGLDVSGTLSGIHLVKNGFCNALFSDVNLGNDITTCAGSNVTLTATGCNGTLTWEEINGGINTLLPYSSSSITVNPTHTTYYRVTCCDTLNCCSDDTIAVIIGGGVSINVTSFDASTCGGLGGFTFIPVGGQAPYTITTNPCPVVGYPCSFNNVSTSFSTLSKYPPGIYTIYITDDNGCIDSVIVTVNEPVAPTINITPVNPLCCGTNGSFHSTITGGQAPYTIRVFTNTSPFQLLLEEYTGINGTTFNSPDDFGEGTVKVYVIDANGCISFALLTITNPANCLTAHAITEAVTCNPCNGKISAYATGGTPFNVNNLLVPYHINITQITGSTPNIIRSSGGLFDNPYYEYADLLCAGDFLIVAIDANGCVDSEMVSLPSLPPPPVDFTLPLAVCKTDASFTITGTPSGGTFTGSNNCVSAAGVFNPANAAIGTNTVTYSKCGATITKTIRVVDCGCCGVCKKPGKELVDDGNFEKSYNGIRIPGYFQSDLRRNCKLCTSAPKGRYCIHRSSLELCVGVFGKHYFKDVNGHGGASSAYMIINGDRNHTRTVWHQRINGIKAGEHYCFSFWINTSIKKNEFNNPEILVKIGGKSVYHQINVDTHGGWMEVKASWDATNQTSIEIEIIQMDPSRFGARDYVYGLDDISFKQCVSVIPKVNLGADKHIIYGQSVTLTPIVNAPNGVLSYSWYPTQETTSSITVSPSSTREYILTVTDSNGCIEKDYITVYVRNGIPVVSPVTCYGLANGSIYISQWIGTPPHAFSWSNGATGNTLTNLSAGTYFVTVTDSIGTITNDSVTLTQPAPLAATVYSQNSCTDEPTGFLELEATGGTEPYYFLWSDSSTTPFIYSIPAGNYSVSISDTNGCNTGSLSYSIQATGNCLGTCCGDGFLLDKDTTVTFDNITIIESDLTQNCQCASGTYCIATNAQNKCSSLNYVTDDFTGTENFLIVQGSNQPNQKIWNTKISVVAGGKYAFKGSLHLKLDPNQPATQLCLAANDSIFACYDSLGNPNTNEWIDFEMCYVATETDSIELSIIQPGTGGAFGIDEISFFTCVPITPIVNTTTTIINTCPGDSVDTVTVTWIGDYPPHEIIWDDGFVGPVRTNLPPGTYPWTITDAIGTTLEDSIIITFINSVPGPITGTPISGCYPAVNTNASYSIPALSGAAYLWNVPSGMTITGGQGTNTLNVSIAGSAINNGINSSICVAATTSCGTNSICMKLDINSVKPVQPGSISGNTKVCPGETVVYSVAAVARTNFYDWSLPTGMTISSGTGTNIITVAIDSTFTGGTISLTANNSCGIGNARTKIVSRNNLLAPASISGLTFGVCSQAAVNYTVANVAGATSYLWSTPPGATLVSGQVTSNLVVDFPSSFTNGNLSVSAVNGCGVGVARTVNVKGLPATPGTITGITQVCTGATYQYSVNTVVGTLNYTWTAPGTISSGQGTKNIQIQYGSSPASNQAITVKASNDCGTSGIRTLGGVTITFCVRIGESDYDVFTVYPNPATDELEIRFASDQETTYQIQLIDASGRLVYDKTNNGTEGLNTSRLNVSEFKRGLYLLQLKSGEHSQTQKVILE